MSFGGFLRMTLIGGRALLVLLTLLPRKGPQVLLTQPRSTFLVSSSGMTILTSTLSIPPRAVPSDSHPMLLWPLPHSHSQALLTPQGQSGVTGAGVEGWVAVCHKHSMVLQEMEKATAKVWRLKWLQVVETGRGAQRRGSASSLELAEETEQPRWDLQGVGMLLLG